MLDSFIGHEVKIIYKDGDTNKAITGVLASIDKDEGETFLFINASRDGTQFVINKHFIVSIKCISNKNYEGGG